MSRSPTCWRNTPGAIRGKTAIVDLESGTAIDFGQLDRVAIDIAAYLKSKGISKGSRVLVLSDECLEKLLIWFGVWRIGAVICPFNLEINEKQMVAADRGAEACADPLSQGDRRRGDGRRRAGASACASARGRRTARRTRRTSCSWRCRAATRRNCPSATTPTDTACIFCTSGTTARPKIVIYNHAAYLDERPRHAGIPRPHRGRPHPGIPLVRLELGAGAEPAAVPAEGPDHAHRQAVLAQPFLRMGAAARHHLLGRRADRAQHPAEQADRLHRQGRADLAADELLDGAA